MHREFEGYIKDLTEINLKLFMEARQVLAESSDDLDTSALEAFVDSAVENIKYLPPDKQSRWLGYLQGRLADLGLLTIEEQRDRTRPLFQALYDKYNLRYESITVTSTI
jgi:hypothetical protein